VKAEIRPGISTADLDAKARQAKAKAKAKSMASKKQSKARYPTSPSASLIVGKGPEKSRKGSIAAGILGIIINCT